MGKGTDHADEEPWWWSGPSYTRITDNTDCEASSETSKTNGKTCTQLNETLEQGHLPLDWTESTLREVG